MLLRRFDVTMTAVVVILRVCVKTEDHDNGRRG
jgi:hypothetical protein